MGRKAERQRHEHELCRPADEEVHTMLKRLRERGAILIAAAGNAGPQSKPL